MFQSGKTYKAKIELSTGEIGFGRAAIVARDAKKILVSMHTAKDENHILPKGTKFFLVGDDANNLFNGLWLTEVAGVEIHDGKTVMSCTIPKFKPLEQHRAAERYSLQDIVNLVTENRVIVQARSINISQTGIALETTDKTIEAGQSVNIVILSKLGEISANCRIARVQNNWLSQNIIVGLEFADIEPGSKNILDKTISAAKEDSIQKVGLASWLHISKDNTSIIKHNKPTNGKK